MTPAVGRRQAQLVLLAIDGGSLRQALKLVLATYIYERKKDACAAGMGWPKRPDSSRFCSAR
eukprot:CAMPEP_0119366910 /NCGR_PEP_ID=MMETSP1334-20130426/13737_1 /TAXON_ID=127549 /ORGANISM="Calcidiscus leptoporus, Strain RCC1130" /LENGTH=61 /DNA_ID=CAMNT_0007383213 /DNA_START=22 /DNA_END=203 /DNA_ORIENTATION=-